MKSVHRSQKLVLSAIVGAIVIPGSAITVNAEENVQETTSPLPVAGIEAVLTECYETNVKSNIDLYLVPTDEGEYLNRAFSNVSDFAYIRNAPNEASDWAGKLYSDSTVTVLEYDGDWTKIQSGSVEGFVPAGVLYTGEEAEQHASEYEKNQATVTANVLNVRDGQGTGAEILTQILEDQTYTVTGEAVDNWYPIEAGEISGWVSGKYITVETTYSYAESKEEEEARLAAEAAAKEEAEAKAEQEAEAAQETQEAAAVQIQTQAVSGQAVIDFACQFIGNPYVWGGTSLTNGADCSGFVQSVYANFGISLPRTTWDMVNVGYEVSYEQALPGDLILYDGHVGLYMGDGNIVNAMNEADGIGICSATYAPIVTIRRVL